MIELSDNFENFHFPVSAWEELEKSLEVSKIDKKIWNKIFGYVSEGFELDFKYPSELETKIRKM